MWIWHSSSALHAPLAVAHAFESQCPVPDPDPDPDPDPEPEPEPEPESDPIRSVPTLASSGAADG
jgi:hypothetical protein